MSILCIRISSTFLSEYFIAPNYTMDAHMHSQTDCSITPKWRPRLTVMLTVEHFLPAFKSC